MLAAAGHRRAARPPLPAGLTAREVEVLRLLALGLTTRQVADRLVISAKTADHHVQHIYTKIGVSTRGAAALFAIEHGLLATSAERDPPTWPVVLGGYRETASSTRCAVVTSSSSPPCGPTSCRLAGRLAAGPARAAPGMASPRR